MEILVKRGETKQGATIGELSIDGVHECFTLEGPVREPATGRPSPWTQLVAWVLSWKVVNHTAIPRGRYAVTITFSPHFGFKTPLLVGVPGYDAVRLHLGNKAADTEGCILVGQEMGINIILKSEVAFKALFAKIQAEITANRPVFLTVE